MVLEGNRVGWAASGRNGGFCEASLTHGAANGREQVPGRVRRAAAPRRGEPGRDRGRRRPATASTATSSRTGSIDVATEDYQVAELRAAAEADGGTFLDAERDAGRGGLPHLPGRRAGTRRAPRWSTRPGSPGAWPPPASGSASASSSARPPPAWPATPIRRERARPGRRAAGPAGRAGHQRVPGAGPPAASLHGAGLRLRARDRAAQRGAAGRGRLAEPAGHR